MSEAEKKWRTYDESLIGHRGTMTLLPEVCISHLSREAYKAAMIREIEKRRDWFEKECTTTYSGRNFKIAELNAILELLDTVEP